jgi:hypothetical protein
LCPCEEKQEKNKRKTRRKKTRMPSAKWILGISLILALVLAGVFMYLYFSKKTCECPIGGSVMSVGTVLTPPSIPLQNSQYFFGMTNTGSLYTGKINKSDGGVYTMTPTAVTTTTGTKCVFDNKGQLILYNGSTPVWSIPNPISNDLVAGNYTLVLGDNGSLTVKKDNVDIRTLDLSSTSAVISSGSGTS